MKSGPGAKVRCAIYTRVSTDQGLDQDFNSLDAQYEACSAYIKSQAHAGWTLTRARYDDGGYSGGSTDRPDLQRLLDDIRTRKIDVIVVYKVDRLTRSLADFAKLVELFDAHSVSFVSVTQQFNTTTSMGRLTLNVLLSLPSSSARSPPSASGTRLQRPSARGSGSEVLSPWATSLGMAGSPSSRTRPNGCG
jgi:predicted site-specific integrase-resolvase